MSATRNPCCCISLRTGAIIVAVFSLVGSVIVAALDLVALVGIVALRAHIAKDTKAAAKLTPEQKASIEGVNITTLVVSLVISVFFVIVSSLLVHGILKQKPQLTTPWLIVTGVNIVFTIIRIILSIVSGGGIALIQVAFSLGFSIWFFSVIYYYKQELTNGGDGREEGKL